MSWKFWTWPAEIRRLNTKVADYDRMNRELLRETHERAGETHAVRRNLSLARRALSRYRKQEGMDDGEIAAAFESLLENKGFEAILALMYEEEAAAADRMSEDGADLAQIKKAAGAFDALTNLHARFIQLEEQAKRTAQRKAGKAAA